MAWTFLVNQAAATGRQGLNRLIGHLTVTAGWTAIDGGTGSFDAGNNPSPVYGALAAANNMAWTNSWNRIRSPDGREFTIQKCPTSGVQEQGSFRIKYSKSAGFGGGSPSASRTPSAADEILLWGGGTDASPSGQELWTNANHRFNVIAGGASEGYAFLVMGHLDAAAGLKGAFLFDTLEASSYPAADPDPHVLYLQGTNTSDVLGASDLANYAPAGDTYGARAWMPNGYDDGVPSYSWKMVSGLWRLAISNKRVIPGNLGADPATGNDLWFPVPWASKGAQDQTNSIIKGSMSARKGISKLLKWSGSSRNYGDTFTYSSTKDHLYVGGTGATTAACTLVPWDGSDMVI